MMQSVVAIRLVLVSICIVPLIDLKLDYVVEADYYATAIPIKKAQIFGNRTIFNNLNSS